MKNLSGARLVVAVVAAMAAWLLVTPRAALGQNPVQWNGNAKSSIARASEQLQPLLVWVKDGRDVDGDDDNDLEDAQEDCFRDPVVVGIIHDHFVPLRVSRNSRSIEEMKRLGLPTGFGLYCAVVTPDGTVLETMGPGEVAQPDIFVQKLNAAYVKYCGSIYDEQLRPVLEDMKSPKSKARRAAQVVWRLGIKKADTAIVGLLARDDLTETEKRRVYELLAWLGTKTSVGALLERAEDKEAANAMTKAAPGALEWLVPALPNADAAAVTGEAKLTEKELAVYTAVAKVCRTTACTKEWWESAKPEAKQKELERVKAKAETVLTVWRERQGQ